MFVKANQLFVAVNRKYILLWTVAWVMTTLPGYPEKVPPEKARQVALNIYLERAPDPLAQHRANMFSRFSAGQVNGKILYYIFYGDDNHGFVIISADDQIPPVLAYSFRGSFQPGKPPASAFSWFMSHLQEQMLFALDQNLPPSPETTHAWILYSSPEFTALKGISGVSPMIQTTWDQGCYYNEQCPEDAGATNYCNHTPTGCGATVMAQILKFWGSPLHGVGSHSYYHPVYGTLSANFGAATYNYNAMPLELENHHAGVAQLMYHCGVAQDMDYGPAGSSSYSSAIDVALKTYFDYQTILQWKWKNAYTPQQWITLLKDELEEGRPMIYYGNDNGQNGHFFICDGYQETDFFHFNWGWGGYLDGYFYTNDLTPGTYNFTFNQGAIFNIYPNQPPPPPPSLTMTFETINDFSLTFDPWTVTDVDGQPTYQITNHTFPHSGDPMAFICFNPAQVNPPMNTDPAIQPHTGDRFGASFSAVPPPNNDWFISPQVQLLQGGEFSFWVKSYTADYGLERFKVGISTTTNNPASFTFISPGPYLEAPTQWTKQIFDLSAYNNQQVYLAIQCVSHDAFIFMIDDLEITTGSSGGLPSYMTLDFESLADFTLDFNPWTVADVNGGNTYGIQNISFPHSHEPMAYICFNPGQTSPPMTNMSAYSGFRLGACFSSVPPHNPNNKWLISPRMQFGSNPSVSLWVQSYSLQYGPEKFNIGVSTSGNSPGDFVIVNTGGPVEAPMTWARKTFSLGAFANQAVYVGIQCVSDTAFIFLVDDIEISGNVAVEEDEIEDPVTVFPNPAGEKVFVAFQGNIPEEIHLRLINSLGETVQNIISRGIHHRIEIITSGLSRGLYYLIIQYGTETLVKKVTIM